MITIIAKFNVLNGSVDEFKKCAVNVVRDTRIACGPQFPCW